MIAAYFKHKGTNMIIEGYTIEKGIDHVEIMLASSRDKITDNITEYILLDDKLYYNHNTDMLLRTPCKNYAEIMNNGKYIEIKDSNSKYYWLETKHFKNRPIALRIDRFLDLISDIIGTVLGQELILVIISIIIIVLFRTKIQDTVINIMQQISSLTMK